MSFISHLAVALLGNVVIWGAIAYYTIHATAHSIAHLATIIH